MLQLVHKMNSKHHASHTNNQTAHGNSCLSFALLWYLFFFFWCCRMKTNVIWILLLFIYINIQKKKTNKKSLVLSANHIFHWTCFSTHPTTCHIIILFYYTHFEINIFNGHTSYYIITHTHTHRMEKHNILWVGSFQLVGFQMTFSTKNYSVQNKNSEPVS